MAIKQKVILPGEEITTEEQYVPGRNAYAQNGIVKSKIMGAVEFDDTNKEVRVKGKSIRQLVVGDIITGKVMLVKESTVVIELLSAEGGKKITGIKTAQLPVRNISTEYVSEIKKTCKIGDLVRARTTMVSPLAIDVATNEKGLGVIKAYCSNCRNEMQYSNEKLMCIECGSIEERKWFEAEQKPREFRPREEGGFRGGHGGGFRPREGGGHGFRPRREGNFGGERRSFGGDRSNRSFGGERSFGSDRPNRSFEGGRENRSFGHNTGEGRDNRGFRPRREGNFGGRR